MDVIHDVQVSREWSVIKQFHSCFASKLAPREGVEQVLATIEFVALLFD